MTNRLTQREPSPEKYEVTVYRERRGHPLPVSSRSTVPARVKDAISACGDFTPLADKKRRQSGAETDGRYADKRTGANSAAKYRPNSRAKCQIRAEFLRQCRNREHQYGNERAARHTAGSRPCHCRQNH